MRTIGITGGVGSGKSELLSYIRTHYNCRVIMADAVAHALEEVGQPCYEALVSLLGRDILQENGSIHTGRMATRMFADERLLEKVNHIVHPAVFKWILSELHQEEQKGEYDFFFVEAALLLEEHYDTILDELWYIYTEETVRRSRLMQTRGYSEDKITQMIGKQLPESEFRMRCQVIIENNGSLEEAYRQIDKRLEAYL
ncbi:MAG: dephospho-CoA kinase [Lachnospiraceae bacterium]